MDNIKELEKQEGVTYYKYFPAVKIARLGVHKDFLGYNIDGLE